MNTDQSGGIYLSVSIDDSKARESLSRIRREAASTGESIEHGSEQLGRTISNVSQQVEGNVGGVANSLKNMAAAAGIAFGLAGAKQFAVSIINVRKEIESLEISFRSLLGSKEAGDELFQSIKEFAVRTPMMLGDLSKGAQTLLGFGTATEKVMPLMKALGDISMGDTQRFQALTLAFAQASAAGKLMGQDLLQMINAGFQPLEIMAKKTGKTIGQLKDEMSKGLITAAMLEDAVMSAAGEGGKFYGMLESQSKGLGGSISNLSGAVQDMLNEIGEKSQGVISDAISFATTLVKNYETVGKALFAIVAGYGAYKAALAATIILQKASAAISYIKALQATTVGLQGATKAQLLLNKAIGANPYVKLASILITVAGLIWAFASSLSAAEKAQKRMSEATQKLSDDIYTETSKVDRLFDKLKSAKEGTEEYEQAKKSILDQYGSLLDKYNDEVKTLKDVEAAYRAVTDAVVEGAKAKSIAKFEEDESEDFLDDVKERQKRLERNIENAARDNAKADALKRGLSKADRKKLIDQKVAEAKEDYKELTHLAFGDKEATDYQKKLIEKYETDFVTGGSKYQRGKVLRVNRAKGILSGAREDYVKSKQKVEDYIQSIHGSRKQKDTEEAKPDPKLFADDKILDELIAKRQQYNALKGKGDAGALKAAQEELAVYEQIWDKRHATLDTEDAIAKRVEILGKKSKALQIGSSEKAFVDRELAATKARIPVKSGAGAAEKAKLRKLHEQYGLELVKQQELLAVEEQQARIDAMKEGLAKELEQNKLNYRKRINALKEQEHKMLEALRDVKEAEFKAAHPNTKATFDRSSVSRENLPAEQETMLQEYGRLAEEAYQQADRKLMEQTLEEIRTYSEKRLKIQEEYKRREESLYDMDEDGSKQLKSGVSSEHIEELQRQAKEAVEQLDLQEAQRSEEFQAWAAAVTKKSLEQIKAMLQLAKQQLETIEKNPQSTSKEKAAARAKVQTLEKLQRGLEGEQNVLTPEQRTIEQWEKLHSALSDIQSQFQKIGDEVGGVAGEIIKAAGGVASSTLSMINGIVTLVTSAAASTSATAGAAGSSIKTLERASIILGIISAALGIAMRIAELFSSDKEREKRIAAITREMAALDKYINDEAGRNMKRNGVDPMEAFNQSLSKAPVRIETTRRAWGGFSMSLIAGATSIRANGQLLEKHVEKMVSAYRNLAYSSDKALGTDRYKAAQEAAEAHAKKQLALQAQLEEERQKKRKKRDKEKEERLEREIAEEGKKAKKQYDALLEELLGGDVKSLAQQLGDAIVEAFARGEDAAKAWGDAVKDIVKGVMKRILIQRLIEKPLADLIDQFQKTWMDEKGNPLTGEAANKAIMDFMKSLMDKGQEIMSGLEGLDEATKNMLKEVFGVNDREASKKGIAAASQDSIDELNGRMTSVQAHTFSIAQGTRTLAENSHNILRSVVSIEHNTNKIIDRIDGTNREVAALRRQVETAASRGIKVK